MDSEGCRDLYETAFEPLKRLQERHPELKARGSGQAVLVSLGWTWRPVRLVWLIDGLRFGLVVGPVYQRNPSICPKGRLC